ncbi:hypothetical protein PAECIP111891_06706 [Paenibacillus allorhizoplanae]|uniref:Mannosyl-glycoprotein endo-beta-N-acetylglucosamidase-like domain-containing protein n=1 Tax=Paenibacillus allorhizoplanae TaxID=2905648 RepID=A0ABM9D0A9_9BACL|nr:glucosaminidase domain-containing protein [Paenibacillus allorhizoplanae]CAH1230638.1 hypothetical protein PAECIP111891_06706 [Paenibacillus allorhizoplanae]
MDLNYWWRKAKEASEQVGWFPTVILAQWQLETGHFTSSNFVNNNNIAGQTWQSYMPESIRGTARPKAEGGSYIRYDDPVIGYVDFIQKNGRYANVKLQETEEGQIREIAARGWAVDPKYAEKLIDRLNDNKAAGYVLEEEEDVPMKLEEWQWDMLYQVMGKAYNVDQLDWDWMQKIKDRTLTATELAFLNTVLDARIDRKIEV